MSGRDNKVRLEPGIHSEPYKLAAGWPLKETKGKYLGNIHMSRGSRYVRSARSSYREQRRYANTLLPSPQAPPPSLIIAEDQPKIPKYVHRQKIYDDVEKEVYDKHVNG